MPKRQVQVRSHERRKPHKNARITVKYYIREEKVGKGRHRDIDKETEGIMVIEGELHPDYRYCERCGDHMDPKGMVRLQNGRWLCKGCDAVEKKEPLFADITVRTPQVNDCTGDVCTSNYLDCEHRHGAQCIDASGKILGICPPMVKRRF